MCSILTKGHKRNSRVDHYNRSSQRLLGRSAWLPWTHGSLLWGTAGLASLSPAGPRRGRALEHRQGWRARGFQSPPSPGMAQVVAPSGDGEAGRSSSDSEHSQRHRNPKSNHSASRSHCPETLPRVRSSVLCGRRGRAGHIPSAGAAAGTDERAGTFALPTRVTLQPIPESESNSHTRMHARVHRIAVS